jgi:hypothetical protein
VNGNDSSPDHQLIIVLSFGPSLPRQSPFPPSWREQHAGDLGAVAVAVPVGRLLNSRSQGERRQCVRPQKSKILPPSKS